jgi:signal transduction histidine kinase
MSSEQPINILLVDDRAENLLALAAMLEPLGYNLVKARSGQEALRYVLHEDFALILLDVQMPGMDGFETAELIRGRERSRHIPIIFLTAVNTSERHIFRGYLAGAVDYLLKPFVPEILLSKVAVFVDLHQKTNQIQRQASVLAASVEMLEYQVQERQRTEAALRQAHDELEARVSERTANLAAANEALRAEIEERRRLEAQLLQAQKMESIGRLAGGVAHDFNNLLTAIKGYAELALAAVDDPEQVRQDLSDISKATERATALTRQLLAFARRQIIDPRVIDLGELIRNIESMLQRLIGEDIDLEIRVGQAPERIKADPGQIEQLLINLVVNARDAMPDGGKLTIETASVGLDAQGAPLQGGDAADSALVMLAVSDTGTGIAPEAREHLFEPFFTTKGPGKGTGLGLATCYGIISQHNGQISYTSEVGRGTTFNIFLPCAAEALDAYPTYDEERTPPGGDEVILLVEDETSVRELTARILRQLGYTILEAANGEEALQRVTAGGPFPQLLLTDVIMPRMSGRTLAEHLTRLHPELKVLFISGYSDHVVTKDRRLEAGVALLQKPFSPAKLARKVRDVLDDDEYRGALRERTAS